MDQSETKVYIVSTSLKENFKEEIEVYLKSCLLKWCNLGFSTKIIITEICKLKEVFEFMIEYEESGQNLCRKIQITFSRFSNVHPKSVLNLVARPCNTLVGIASTKVTQLVPYVFVERLEIPDRIKNELKYFYRSTVFFTCFLNNGRVPYLPLLDF